MLISCVCMLPLVATDGNVVRPVVDTTTCATPPAKPVKKEKKSKTKKNEKKNKKQKKDKEQ